MNCGKQCNKAQSVINRLDCSRYCSVKQVLGHQSGLGAADSSISSKQFAGDH